MHATLTLDGQVLMGGDVAPDQFEAPKGFSMSLTMKSEADAERIFNELAKDGRVAAAAPARPAPPLPAPAGAIVNVSSESQLRTAASRLASNTTIVVTPGVYVLQDTIYINGTFTNVGIRGSSGNADDVVLKGPGVTDPAIPHGIWVGGSVAGVTIANLTIRDVFFVQYSVLEDETTSRDSYTNGVDVHSGRNWTIPAGCVHRKVSSPGRRF